MGWPSCRAGAGPGRWCGSGEREARVERLLELLNARGQRGCFTPVAQQRGLKGNHAAREVLDPTVGFEPQFAFVLWARRRMASSVSLGRRKEGLSFTGASQNCLGCSRVWPYLE